MKIRKFSRVAQKVLEMCPRAPQTSPIDRKWKVELIYDGFMLRWLDRLAIGAENDRSTSQEPVERFWRPASAQNASETLYRYTVRLSPNPHFQKISTNFGSGFDITFLYTY